MFSFIWDFPLAHNALKSLCSNSQIFGVGYPPPVVDGVVMFSELWNSDALFCCSFADFYTGQWKVRTLCKTLSMLDRREIGIGFLDFEFALIRRIVWSRGNYALLENLALPHLHVTSSVRQGCRRCLVKCNSFLYLGGLIQKSEFHSAVRPCTLSKRSTSGFD